MITIRRLGLLVTTVGLASPGLVPGALGGIVRRPLTGWPLGTPWAVTRFSTGLSLLPPSPPAPIAPGGIIGIPVIPVCPGMAGMPPVGGIIGALAPAGVVGGDDVGTGGGPSELAGTVPPPPRPPPPPEPPPRPEPPAPTLSTRCALSARPAAPCAP